MSLNSCSSEPQSADRPECRVSPALICGRKCCVSLHHNYRLPPRNSQGLQHLCREHPQSELDVDRSSSRVWLTVPLRRDRSTQAECERFSQSVRQLLDSEHQAREKSTRIMKIRQRERESNPRVGVPAAPVEYPIVLSCTGFRESGCGAPRPYDSTPFHCRWGERSLRRKNPEAPWERRRDFAVQEVRSVDYASTLRIRIRRPGAGGTSHAKCDKGAGCRTPNISRMPPRKAISRALERRRKPYVVAFRNSLK